MRVLQVVCLLSLILASGSAADTGSLDMDVAARASYRPAWGPLPLFHGETSCANILLESLSAPDAHDRARAAFLLGQIGWKQPVSLLRARLGDRDRSVRVQCGIALACLGDADGVPVCSAALASESECTRFYAVYGLWSLNSKRARQVLANAKPKQSELIRQTIDKALKTRYTPAPAVSYRSDVGDPGMNRSDVWASATSAFDEESDWWWHQGDYSQAIRCREAGLLFDPKYVESYNLIAWLQWSMGNDALAIKTLKRGVSAAPNDPRAFFNLGFHYENTKRFSLAEEPLRKAVELGGDHLMHRQYAHCLEKLGKLQQAVEQWAELVEARPDDQTIRNNYERARSLLESAPRKGN